MVNYSIFVFLSSSSDLCRHSKKDRKKGSGTERVDPRKGKLRVIIRSTSHARSSSSSSSSSLPPLLLRRRRLSISAPAADALWSGTNKNRDVSTGPLARPFTCSLALLFCSLAPDCLLHSRPPLRSLVCSLAHFAHSLTRGKVNF